MGEMAGEDADQNKLLDEYCLYDLLRFLFSATLSISMVFIGIRLSRLLHENMVFKLIRASFPKFFNVVMTGRLMNRFSKDIYNIDIYMISELLISMSFLLQVICYFISYFLLGYYTQAGFLILGIALITLFYYFYIRVNQEMSRIEAISKSPVLNFYSEVIRGVQFVRLCLSKVRLCSI